MEPILGAFLAGALFTFVFREKGILETKLSGLGHGFFIPVFFIHVGVSFDLEALADPAILPLLVQVLAMSFLVKLLASLPLAFLGFRPRQIAGAALLLATPLTLLVAIAALGLELGVLNELESAAVILTAAISALLFPTVFRRVAGKTLEPKSSPTGSPDGDDSE
jgi:Kef-type K+ transport system membrane component KefB